MIAGRKERFAIEAEPLEIQEGWILGRIRFWICNQPVGNWEDFADLRGCIHWLRDFAANPRDRFDPRLVAAAPDEVYAVLFGAAMSAENTRVPVEDAYARFFISHLGMSSMERFDILLLYDEHGGERVIWRSIDSPTLWECRLWRMEMENVATEFCDLFDQEIQES